MKNKIRLILTGATGMVGEGVLRYSLAQPDVEKILIINRKPAHIKHPKLREIIHPDFFDLKPIEKELKGYNACFFCLGISSVGVGKKNYYRITYDLTLNFAKTLAQHNPELTFNYISGAGTDSKGRLHWSRVKAKTEKDLRNLPYRNSYSFRPGFIKPTKDMKNAHKFYRVINPLFPLARNIYPKGFCTMEELAQSMINAVLTGYIKPVLEGDDIIKLAKRKT